MGIRRYQDAIAWQLADALRNEVHRLVNEHPAVSSDLRFKSQLLEASSGVCHNFVEGFLRFSAADFGNFLRYSLGSLGEAESRLQDGIARHYWREDECHTAFRLTRRCAKALSRFRIGLAASAKSTPNPRARPVSRPPKPRAPPDPGP